MLFAPPEVSGGPRSLSPSSPPARFEASPVRPKVGTWIAHELVKQKINKIPHQGIIRQKKIRLRANLDPSPSTPCSAPGAAGSLHEATGVRPAFQPGLRPTSAPPKGKVRVCTPRGSR